MKILQVVHRFPPENFAGTELHTYSVSKELASRGHDLSIFTSSNAVDCQRYETRTDEFDGLKVVRLRSWFEDETEMFRTFLDFQAEERFRKHVREFRPDIVHIQHLFCLSASFIQMLSAMSIPFVLTAHDYWYVCPRIQLLDYQKKICPGPRGGHECEWCVVRAPQQREIEDNDALVIPEKPPFSLKRMLPTRFKHWLKTTLMPRVDEIWQLRAEVAYLKWKMETLYAATYFVGRYNYMIAMLEKAPVIITPSEYAKRKYIAFGICENKIKAIPHGLNTKSYENPAKRPGGLVRFAYFGGLMRHKGIETLLIAFAEIPGSKASLRIFGPSLDPDYEIFIRKLAGSAPVIFEGKYENDQMPEILSEVDVVVVPSLWEETFNLVVREAFMAKTPVIASRIGALAEAVEDGVDGLLVKPGNADELRQKMELFIFDSKILPRLAGRIKPVKDISEQTTEIEDIYKHVMNERKDLR